MIPIGNRQAASPHRDETDCRLQPGKDEGDIVISSITELFLCVIATTLAAAFGAGTAAAQAIDFSRVYYEGRWDRKGNAKTPENNQNVSRLHDAWQRRRAHYRLSNPLRKTVRLLVAKVVGFAAM